jgi:hypothetical protein
MSRRRRSGQRGLLLLAALLLAAGLGACASIDTSYDYDQSADFSGYRSWDFFPGGRELSGHPRLDTPFVDARIRDSLLRHMAARGFQKVEDRTPDFYVNYQLSVQQKISSSSANVHYGMGTYGSWGGVGIGTSSPMIRQYEEGTLVIDFVDAASRKLVWRGTGSGALASEPTPEETTRGIDRAVSKVLEQFPPGS